MRTIKNLIQPNKKVYLLLKDKETQCRFMCDAEREKITYGDSVTPTQRPVEEIMSLQPDGTICFLGWAGRVCYHYARQKNVVRIDYERYVNENDDYIIE